MAKNAIVHMGKSSHEEPKEEPKPEVKAEILKAEPLPAPFAVGSIVNLKSGGPRMTVAACDPTTTTVHWFVDNNLLQSASIPTTSLQEK